MCGAGVFNIKKAPHRTGIRRGVNEKQCMGVNIRINGDKSTDAAKFCRRTDPPLTTAVDSLKLREESPNSKEPRLSHKSTTVALAQSARPSQTCY